MGPFGTQPVHLDSQGNHVEPVTGIEERIAEVLKAHDFRRAKGTHASQCRCGWLWESNEAHRSHVAAAVAAVLDSDGTTGAQ